jgi:hypothetical protein
MAGPPITVTCECGERHDLAYGDRWRCEKCGRSYDSNRIPPEEYAQVRRLQRRYRVLPVAVGLTVLAFAMLFTLTGNIYSVFFLLPVGLMVWFVFLRPAHRRRYRAAIADLPKWSLRAD